MPCAAPGLVVVDQPAEQHGLVGSDAAHVRRVQGRELQRDRGAVGMSDEVRAPRFEAAGAASAASSARRNGRHAASQAVRRGRGTRWRARETGRAAISPGLPIAAPSSRSSAAAAPSVARRLGCPANMSSPSAATRSAGAALMPDDVGHDRRERRADALHLRRRHHRLQDFGEARLLHAARRCTASGRPCSIVSWTSVASAAENVRPARARK